MSGERMRVGRAGNSAVIRGGGFMAGSLAAVLAAAGLFAVPAPADAGSGAGAGVSTGMTGLLLTEKSDGAKVEEKDIAIYAGSMDSWIDSKIFFINGVNDVPYVELSEWADVLSVMHRDYAGNLVPSAFKTSHLVTLLGRTTGGGSCMVLPLSTAYGSLLQISSPLRMSAYKNGSSYDIDRGIEPDYTINSIASYYDREALTEYINGLF